MAFNNDEFTYSIADGFDHIIEEKGNQFTALRKIAWNGSDNYKLDLRKYYSTADGGEKMGKGLSFMTDEGPAELVKVLLREGYTESVDVIDCIKDRPDFRSALNSVLNKDDEFYDESAKDIKADYYDPKELLA